MQESQEHTAAQSLVTKLVQDEQSQGSGKEVKKNRTWEETSEICTLLSPGGTAEKKTSQEI